MWERGEEPDFGRVAYFTDAVYAIALTLLVLDLRLPRMTGDSDSASSMLAALNDLIPKFVSFGVAFVLLARYWMANHSFFTRIGRVDRRYIGISMFYLAGVAFLPFPTSLVGEFEANPISGVMFALTLAAVSGLGTMLMWHAHSAGLWREQMSEEVHRWQIIGSLVPFAMFLATIPLAFVNTTVMLLSWLVIGPVLGHLVGRRRPEGAVED